MKGKSNIFKLIALSSLIWIASPIESNNNKLTAQEKNSTSLETTKNKQNNRKQVTAETKNGFKGVVQACNRSSQSVKCDVSIISTKTDVEVTLFARMPWANGPYRRIIDLNGNEFMASSVIYGRREYQKYFKLNLVQGIPHKVRLTFINVPVQSNNLALLEVDASNYFKLQFRDVTIE